MNSYNVKVLSECDDAGFFIMEFEDGPFKGVTWTYGAVSFVDDEHDPRISFDYTIKSNSKLAEPRNLFEDAIGQNLIRQLEQSIENNEVVYSGGVDETKAKSNSD